MSLKTDYSNIKNPTDLYKFLNETAKTKKINLIDTSEVKQARSEENLSEAIIKITLDLIEKNRSFYVVEDVNLGFAFFNKGIEIYSGERLKRAVKLLSFACEHLPPPQDEFFPHQPSEAPEHILQSFDKIARAHINGTTASLKQDLFK